MIKKSLLDLCGVVTLMVLMILCGSSCNHKSEVTPVTGTYQVLTPVILPSLEKFDQPYGTSSRQKYDLFLPMGRDRNTRVILLLHGGGWVSGEKEYLDSYARLFAGMGYAAISMNYRLASDTIHYQAMLGDIGSMAGCIVQNRAAWGIGEGPLSLFGYSAGGHLALLYAYSGNTGQNISAVISLAGPTDIQDSLLWSTPALLAGIRLMAGDTLPSNWIGISPVHFVTPSAPPTFLIHGILDELVPLSQSLKLNHLLSLAHVKAKVLLLENQTHYPTNDAVLQVTTETAAFLNETLK